MMTITMMMISLMKKEAYLRNTEETALYNKDFIKSFSIPTFVFLTMFLKRLDNLSLKLVKYKTVV